MTNDTPYKNVLKRKSTSFVKKLPKGSGAIVSMVNFNGRLYVASQQGIWYLKDINKKTRFVRCKFKKERTK